MSFNALLITLLALLALSYFIGQKRAIAVSSSYKGRRNLHSRPNYYGYMVVIWTGIPVLLVVLLWSAFDSAMVTSLTTAGLPESMQPQTKDNLGVTTHPL